MQLINDYFLLYHGLQYAPVGSGAIKEVERGFFYEIAGLLLSTTRKEWVKLKDLPSFKKGILALTDASCQTLNELFVLQAALIDYIHKNQTSEEIRILHEAFNYLLSQRLLSHDNHQKLLSLFTPHIFHTHEETALEQVNEDLNFLERKAEIEILIKELSEASENKVFRESLGSVQTYLQSQKFSVGITGVMNAGKSSLLNAFLSEEILGTSVVPETATLSLLKYSQEPYARVVYWSKEEWEKIVEYGSELESMALFVKQTQETFKADLSEYIKEDNRVDEIKIKELSLYTSANQSGRKCNLIKQVELGVNLEFLSEGIEIVDTPGLDDIVIQREEITKEYLAQCDLMIHLMNAAQAVTHKDIAFIMDTLRYQNISRLLIVLTRADTIKASELQEVIDYTKKSIKTRLAAINELAQFDSLISSLHFIAVSSKMALYHRTGRAELALEQGYTLERSGILDVEAYLYKTLYGNASEKSDLIIRSCKSRLHRGIETEIQSLRYELHLLGQSKDELILEREKISLKKGENERLVNALKEELSSYKQEIKVYSSGLEMFLDAQMLKVKQRLLSRLTDDLVYALEKKNKKQFIDSIDAVVERAIKDGLIDVIREYRYKFIKKAEEIGQKIAKKYDEYLLALDNRSQSVNTLELMNEHFKGNLVSSNAVILSARLKKICDKGTLKNISSIQGQLDIELKQAFSLLQDILKQKASMISADLIEEIFINICQPLESLEKNLSNEELLLEHRLRDFEEDDQKRAAMSIQIHQQIKSLQSLSLRCRI